MKFIFLAALLSVFSVFCAYAQEQSQSMSDQPVVAEAPKTPALPDTSIVLSLSEKAQSLGSGINTNDMASILFTPDEFALIQEAKQRFVTRPPLPGEIDTAAISKDGEPISPGIRELSLSGIVYNSSKDWTIWLNKQRVRPDAIPSEVLDLRVYKDHIQLKWYDAYTNKIFPIRLRTHQRFNLDTLLFLPG